MAIELLVLDPCSTGADGKVRLGTSSCSQSLLLPGLRYAIDRSTDVKRIFDIDANTGAIVTGKVLDRETAGWHNITVLAMEAGEVGVLCGADSLCWARVGQRGKCRYVHCGGEQDASVS